MKQKKTFKRKQKMSDNKTRKRKHKCKYKKLNYLGGTSNTAQNIENNDKIVKDARYYLVPQNVELLNFNKNSNKMIKISGALGIFRFSNLGKHKRNIILLGEEHSNIGSCKLKDNSIAISDLLNGMTENPKVCIDLFVEDFYKTSKYYDEFKDYEQETHQSESITYSAMLKDKLNTDVQIDKIRTVMADCLAKNKEYCRKNNSRLHMIDSRIIQNTDTRDNFVQQNGIGLISPLLYDVLFNNVQKNLSLVVMNQTVELIKNNLKELILYHIGVLTNNNNKLIDKLMILLMKTENLKEQSNKWHESMSKILDKEKNKIIDYGHVDIDNCIIHIAEQNINNKIKALNTTNELMLKKDILESILFALTMLTTDAYFIYRWLMVFDDSGIKKNEKQKNCDVRCINSIVYTGMAHTLFYVKFIEKFFNAKPNYEKENYTLFNKYLNENPSMMGDEKSRKKLEGKLSCLKIPEKWLSFS